MIANRRNDPLGMVSARHLIELCELPASLGVRVEAGYRDDTRCEGRAVFDMERLEGKEVRYSLSALWNEDLRLLFGIGFNPSMARACSGDQTVNRVIRAAQDSKEYGGVFWVNLAAQMETDAKTFIKEGSLMGRLNGEQIRTVLETLSAGEARRDVLLAWGNDGPNLRQWLKTTPYDARIQFLTFGTTNKNRPRHPSRLKGKPQFELADNYRPLGGLIRSRRKF